MWAGRLKEMGIEVGEASSPVRPRVHTNDFRDARKSLQTMLSPRSAARVANPFGDDTDESVAPEADVGSTPIPEAATAQKDRPRGLTKVFTGWQDNEADTKAIRGVVVEDDRSTSTAAPDSGAATAQKDRPRGLTTVFTGWQSDEEPVKRLRWEGCGAADGEGEEDHAPDGDLSCLI